jgi:hypothetical protein
MFYSSRTILADSQCNAYWQENLGIYAGNNPSSASPLIVGLFIHETNNPPPYNTMAGMLAKVDTLLSTYPIQCFTAFSSGYTNIWMMRTGHRGTVG